MDMEQEHRKQVDQDIHDIKNKIASALPKIDLMYSALVGNKIANDGGLFGRMTSLEKRVTTVEDEVEAIKGIKSKQQVYINIIWIAVGSLVTLIISHFLNK